MLNQQENLYVNKPDKTYWLCVVDFLIKVVVKDGVFRHINEPMVKHPAYKTSSWPHRFRYSHNTRGKVNPVHCQKKIHGQNTNVMCEVTDCINAIQDATRSNINHFECAHIQSISKSIGDQQTNQLKDDYLENFSSTGQFYMFSDMSIANLKTIRDECLESNTVPTVQFPCEEDNRFWFFSVVNKDEEKKYYA